MRTASLPKTGWFKDHGLRLFSKIKRVTAITVTLFIFRPAGSDYLLGVYIYIRLCYILK